MKRAWRWMLIIIALLALLILNVYALALPRIQSYGGGMGSSGQSLTKDSGMGTSLDRSSEVPEIYNDTEGSIPQDDNKG